MNRSRRAGLSRDEARRQPMYARLLGLQYLAPSGFLCFVFLEGAVALGILLALAELVSWWGVLVLPVTVAVMVKLNDVVAGALTGPAATPVRPSRPAPPQAAPVLRPAAAPQNRFAGDLALSRARTVDLRVPGSRSATSPVATAIDAGPLNGPPSTRQWAEELDLREQRARQSASRRNE